MFVGLLITIKNARLLHERCQLIKACNCTFLENKFATSEGNLLLHCDGHTLVCYVIHSLNASNIICKKCLVGMKEQNMVCTCFTNKSTTFCIE